MTELYHSCAAIACSPMACLDLARRGATLGCAAGMVFVFSSPGPRAISTCPNPDRPTPQC